MEQPKLGMTLARFWLSLWHLPNKMYSRVYRWIAGRFDSFWKDEADYWRDQAAYAEHELEEVSKHAFGRMRLPSAAFAMEASEILTENRIRLELYPIRRYWDIALIKANGEKYPRFMAEMFAIESLSLLGPWLYDEACQQLGVPKNGRRLVYSDVRVSLGKGVNHG